MKVKVYAKLNLTLSVGAKQGEFHPIDSVATSVDLCDVVEVTPRSDAQVVVHSVDQVPYERNSAYKAAVAFRHSYSQFIPKNENGVEIFVKKGIPFGGGLGGSSADAAAVVYCMCKLFGVDVRSRKVHELCAKLGSDVNFMLFGGLGRLQGKGDDVTFAKLAKPLYFALTTFDCSMNSGEVYTAFDNFEINNSRFSTPYSLFESKNSNTCWNLLKNGDMQAIAFFSNDLQQATASISHYADEYVAFVRSNSWRCTMTGSGSAYFIACETAEKAEQITKLLNDNGFTTTVCQSVPSGIVEI